MSCSVAVPLATSAIFARRSFVNGCREIQQEVETLIGGKPAKPRLTDTPVAVVKWVDGTVIDTVWQLAE